MKKSKPISLFISFLLFAVLLPVKAQHVWYNPLESGFPVIQNQGWTEEIGKSYVRLPDRAEGRVRKPVWDLSRNSSGLSIHFRTDAPEIVIRYAVEGNLSMYHMPTTGVSGIDMYSTDKEGNLIYCAGKYAFSDTINLIYGNLEYTQCEKEGREYRMFLPLYNTVQWLEIGIPENSRLSFIPKNREKPIVLYGTSIAQGACASRPAMAWANIVQRSLKIPLVNLGFSGNGRLEPEVFNFITEIDASLFILDCLPNLTGREENEVYKLITDAVGQIRQKHNAPILLVEHIGYSNALTDNIHYQEYNKVNRASRKALETLRSNHVENIYYITNEELNLPADGWVDHIHPSDLGMQKQADIVKNKIKEILNK